MKEFPWQDTARHTSLLKRREELREKARSGKLDGREQAELANVTWAVQQIEQAQAQERHP